MTLVHGVAVTAAAVQLAKVLDGKVRDGQGTSTVVLEHLVVSAGGTTTLDVLNEELVFVNRLDNS